MSGETEERSRASSAPRWDLVMFEVGCARCGHDLRGLSEPRCPACALVFDWADAVPLERLTCAGCGYHLYGLSEMRCPECGQGFTWEEALTHYHRLRKPLFEYRWRDEPVRSFLRTWWRALWPRSFWARLDIHDPPMIRPLLNMVAVLFVIFAVSMVVLDGVETWMYWRTVRRWSSRYPGFAQIPQILQFIFRSFSSSLVRDTLVATLVWLASSLVAMLIFQQSMRLCHVRTVHVVRVWAYALAPIVPVVTVGSYVAYCIGLFLGVRILDPYFLLAVLMYVPCSIHYGYKTYLRMRHSAAVAVVSQGIAVLATVSLLLLLRSGGYMMGLFIELLDILNLL